MVEADGKLRLTFGEEKLVIPRGLQPSMLCTKTGTLIVQAQYTGKIIAVFAHGISLRARDLGFT